MYLNSSLDYFSGLNCDSDCFDDSVDFDGSDDLNGSNGSNDLNDSNDSNGSNDSFYTVLSSYICQGLRALVECISILSLALN